MLRRTRPTVESLEAKALLSGLAYSVTTDKSSYTLGQPVQMTFTETNISNQNVNITLGPSMEGFQVIHDGVTVWASNEGINPFILYEMTLKPGQSYTLKATWNGQQDEGEPTSPVGSFTVTNELAPPSAASAAITITPGTLSTPSFLPLASSSAPFGTGNPDLATAEVKGLYSTILGRSPDPAGMAANLKALQAGATVTQLAQVMLHSTEYESNIVASDYKTYLGRSGLPTEINAWVAQMQAGATAEQVAAGFLMSNESLAAHPDNTSFVQNLYSEVLGRSPSATELSNGVSELSVGGSRAAVVSELLSSTWTNASEVDSLYQSTLGRFGETAGIDAAIAALQPGKFSLSDLAASLFGSVEYAARAKQTVG
jgi:hypothetical protein